MTQALDPIIGKMPGIDTTEKAVDHLLRFLSASKIEKSRHNKGERPHVSRIDRRDGSGLSGGRTYPRWRTVDPIEFDGVEPIYLIDALYGDLVHDTSPDNMILASTNPLELPGGLDVSILHRICKDELDPETRYIDGLPEDEVGFFGVTKVKRVRHTELRGRVMQPRGRHAIEYSFGLFDTISGRVLTYRMYASSPDGGPLSWWLHTGCDTVPERLRGRLESSGESFAQSIGLLAGVQARQNRRWSVLVGTEVGRRPRIRLCTDAEGARILFRDRDRPVGKSRRDALVHWVREHARLTRSDGDPITVARHLRGKNNFQWAGFDCTIIPSMTDLETVPELRAEFFKQESRESWPEFKDANAGVYSNEIPIVVESKFQRVSESDAAMSIQQAVKEARMTNQKVDPILASQVETKTVVTKKHKLVLTKEVIAKILKSHGVDGATIETDPVTNQMVATWSTTEEAAA